MIPRLIAQARIHRAALAALALGVLLRLLFLNERSLWFDEAATLYISRSPLAEVAGRVSALEENPPLHYLLMHFWTFLFSDPVLGLRLFSALCGMASLAAFWALCRRLIPGQEVFALFMGAASSFWIHFSQDGRLYGLLLLVSLCCTHAFLALRERFSPRHALAYALLSCAGLYTHNFFAFLLLGHLAQLFLDNRLRLRSLFPWAALYGAILLSYSPWLVSLFSQIRLLSRASVLQEPLGLGQLFSVAGTMVFDTSFLSLAHEPLTRALGAAVLALSAAGAYLSWPRTRDNASATRLCLIQLLVPLIALRISESVLDRALTQARYLIFISPFLYIWLAVILDRPGRVGRLSRAVFMMILAAGTTGYLAGGRLMDPRLESLSAALRAAADRRDPVVHLEPFYYLPLRYHYLTERAHFMTGPDAKVANWEGLPGYRAYLTPRELESLERCVVVDPGRLLFSRRIGLASGRQVAEAAFPGRQP